MKGLQIWAHSYCRSTLSFYEELGRALGVPVRICLAKTGLGVRAGIGLDETEFDHLEIIEIGDNYEKACKELNKYRNWHQLFGVYQIFPVIQKIILMAYELNCKIGFCSESPLNMYKSSFKRSLKSYYLLYYLPFKMERYIEKSSFIINFSGDSTESLEQMGWPGSKIIPCGYSSNPLTNSSFCPRDINHHEDFHIVCSGQMTWHRGQDVLIDALILLKKWALPFRATITQSGPYFDLIQSKVSKNVLPVSLPGKLMMSDLLELYESCSVYVGTGRAEPWGLRVNDALHCGAPIVVSTGMGVQKTIKEHMCGVLYLSGDSVDLAWQLRDLILDKEKYRFISNNVRRGSESTSPKATAKYIADVLSSNFPDWIDCCS